MTSSGDTNTTNHPTQIAVLGTLAEFHEAPLPYDLAALVDLVLRINPDLLCLDISLSQWQRQDFSGLPPEYSEVLLPLAAQTDMVVVPVGGEQMMPRATAVGWRSRIISWARSVLAQMQASAPGPDAINQGWRHELANVLYSLTRSLSDSAVDHAYHNRIEQVSQAVLQVAENNPGNRILVVTNIQYCHHIRPRLGQHDGVNILAYSDL